MSIKVAISHKTVYKFDRSVKLYPHVFRLRPAAHSRTAIEAYSLKIFPEKHFINWQQDAFGNYQARVVFPDLVDELRVEVEVIAKLQVINPFDFFIEEYAEKFPFTYDKTLRKELRPYLEVEGIGLETLKFIESIKVPNNVKTVDFLVLINQAVFNALNYNIRMEPGVQTCDETLIRKMGSCRDFSWLLVQVLRKFGLAARFVSG